MTQIFYTYISKKNHKQLLNTHLLDFSRDFQNKILKYRRWQDAQLSILGRLLLRFGLNNLHFYYHEKNLKYDYYNKPYLKGENINFNISHSGNLVICVIDESYEIGVDIEMIGDLEFEDFKPQMLETEWTRIVFSNDRKVSFYDYWTQKEAVIKAHGMGLSIPLKSFEIRDNQTTISASTFYLHELKIDDNYKCHLALQNKKPSPNLELREVDFYELIVDRNQANRYQSKKSLKI